MNLIRCDRCLLIHPFEPTGGLGGVIVATSMARVGEPGGAITRDLCGKCYDSVRRALVEVLPQEAPK